MQFYRVALCITFIVAGPSLGAEPASDFNRDIRPILARNCFGCHGPDEGSREADLRLDTAAGAVENHDSKQAVAPGKPETSELIKRIESNDPEFVMPPPDSGHQLNADEKRLLREWIASGAKYDVHWSFIPPNKSPLSDVKNKTWPKHPLDHFVLAKLEAANLSPSEPIDRYRLIRRLSLDLTGLPPTVTEADAFVADETDDAIEKVVDRLMKSSAFGEHWARMWLDLARYADTKGYEKDLPRTMWRYRDWVIEALNNDMPFDQFTREQLAGDLLPNPDTNQLIATAFHRNTMTNDEGGTDNEEFRVAAVKDRVDTTMQVWMGLTMGCAKCHSHKYDPISQSDYYSFYAFFNQTEDADRGDDSPTLFTPTELQARSFDAAGRTVKLLEARHKASPESGDERVKVSKTRLENVRKTIANTPIMRDLAANKQRTTKIHNRGNFLDPDDAVEAAVPELFGPLPEGAPRNRAGVADWLLQPQNPLTARVTVNRIWARLFGIGIVETEEDFGTQGLPPSHPELLDWLAVDFREHEWSLKQLIRSIVLSSTYQQAALITPEKQAADPRNRLLSRSPRVRLSAETVRDQALSLANLLTQKVGGASVMPPQPAGVWKSTYSGLKWENATGPDRYRRSLYTYLKRTSPHPALLTFDAGSGEVCQIRRIRTNTPLQALVTLNEVSFVEAAGALANRAGKFRGSDHADSLKPLFQMVLIRPPKFPELARLVALYETMQQEFPEGSEAQRMLVQASGSKTSDAAMIAVANVLLNLDETLTKP